MHYAVMDLEANGLLYDATKIHCICWKVHLNGKVYDHTYTDNFTEAVELLNQCELVIGHNICGYDAPLLEKLGYGVLDNLRDTMIMGQLVEPDRVGGHSLASYDPDTKVENEDWSVLTENMLKRCVADVDITYRLYKRLEKKMANWDWKPAIELEQEVLKYHARQGLNGVLFDKGKARHIYQIIDKEIKAIDKKLVKEVGYKVKPFDKLIPIPNVDSSITEYEGKVIKPFKVDGTMNGNVAKYYGQQSVWGTTCRVEFYQANLNSPIQIKDYLTSVGWIPDEWNYKIDKLTKRIVYEDGEPVKTTAKISESSMSSVEDELGKMIMRRQIIKHRRSMIYSTKGAKVTGLIGNIRSDGRIEAGGHSCGTNTRRYRHRGVVNIPKASDSVVYGKELRDLFIAPTGYCLMGTDADSLEARIAGHFCAEYDGGAFAEKLLEHDVHQELADFLGINRSEAKTVYYGISYGAQPRKVADTLKVSLKRGKEVFEGFWEKNDALAKVRDASIKQWKNEGYLVALDGGKLFPRSPHSVMNTLFQCAGSLTVKMATIYTNRKIDEEGLNGLVKQVIHYHDEYTLELLDNGKLKDQLTPLVESSWVEAGQHFNLNVGITGSAQYGYSWKEIH